MDGKDRQSRGLTSPGRTCCFSPESNWESPVPPPMATMFMLRAGWFFTEKLFGKQLKNYSDAAEARPVDWDYRIDTDGSGKTNETKRLSCFKTSKSESR